MKIKIDKIFIFLTNLLFFMMLVFPYNYMIVKMILSIVIVLGVIFSIKKINLLPRYRKWIFLYFGMNLIYILYGTLLLNPGVSYYLLVYLVWPILFFIFCSYSNRESINKLLNASFYAFGTIVIIGVLFFFQVNGLIPSIINTDFWDLGYGDRPLFGFQALKMGSIVSFIFLFPFYVTLLIVDKKFSKSIFSKLILILALVYLFATTRRALIFSLFYLPVLIYFFDKMSKRNSGIDSISTTKKLINLFVIPLIFIVIVSAYFNLIDLSMFGDLFSASFSSDDDSFGSDREEQYVALIDGWKTSPFFGVGPGVDASVSRSHIPGAYELSYIALLFSRGLFGFIIYFSQILFLIYQGIKLSRFDDPLKPFLISYNVAFVSFLISNGSNPYLEAYDHIWVIFLYIVLQNVILKSIEENEKNLCNS